MWFGGAVQCCGSEDEDTHGYKASGFLAEDSASGRDEVQT
jgi:hypothetical protein